MTMCSVRWCAALATAGTHCQIHAMDAKVRPLELAADEEPIDIAACDKCKGSGKCQRCLGQRTHSLYCADCGERVYHDCRSCDGTGNCSVCHGRKKDEA